ncbi:Dedicator of cytokinesis protein 5 [Chamberlinius hualienensis]
MNSDVWRSVDNDSKFGVAIFTYTENKPHRLKLFCGDAVHIVQQTNDWYYGYCITSPNKKGIFPNSYIHIKDAIFEKNGTYESVIIEEPPISQEVTAVLREWGAIAKQLFVVHGKNKSKDLAKIQTMMFELIDLRKAVVSGTLPTDELKELNQKMTTLIDIGNWTLSLDLVVRDDQGYLLNPDWTSTITLFRQHTLAAQRIQKTKEGNSFSKPTVKFTHALYLEIKNFVCKIGEDVQLLMTLYDAKEGRFISENYVIKWSKEGLPALDLLNNMKVIFTDLGNADLNRERVYLVCQVIRMGLMELKHVDHKKSMLVQKKANDGLRRPFGVAVMDVTGIMNGSICHDEDKQHFLPFIQCGERDFLDTVIKKLTSSREITQRDSKGQGLWVALKILHGDVKQIREENPHIISIATDTARKMGFPEVIMPGDVRNDLYLTVICGEFAKGAKTSDKNVEVCVKACGEKGQLIPGVISIGSGIDPRNEYCSVVYYHEDKPKWCETIRVAVDIEEFRSCHLLFSFKHRSSNEAKDKSEKLFAISFIRLMLPNGTTVKDSVHDLLVYKVDHKKFEEVGAPYLNLPSTKQELEELRHGEPLSKSALHHAFLTYSPKDSFQISTLVCSTKLTQNVDLLALLKWRDNPENLDSILYNLMNIDGEEVVKFLQDTLDALFNILMDNMESDHYDKKVFDALIYILGLISDSKYRHFKPVLDAYINPTFSAALAYKKLIPTLQTCINEAGDRALLYKIIESLKYIFKFIVRSRWLCAQVTDDDDDEKRRFEESFKQLLKSINFLMTFQDDDAILKVQAACLKYFPSAISDIITVFDAKEMSFLLVYFINNVPPDRLIQMKLYCIQEIIHGDLFKRPDCRAILLPEIIQFHIGRHMEQGEEMELCVTILSDIMDELHLQRVGETSSDVSVVMTKIFRTVVQKVISSNPEEPLMGNLVAVMISILRQMEAFHYKEYIERFKLATDLLDFLMELLMVFTELVKKPVFPKDWNEMIMLQNSVILKTVRHLSSTIRDVFNNHFEIQVWNNYFHCAIFFLTQDALQLEYFSRNKKKKIISRYGDMRRDTAFQIRAMWFNLGQNKIHFVPGLVGLFLEMTLVPELELRKSTIPIFFDMMQCEFRSPKYLHMVPLCDQNYLQQSQIHLGGCIKGNFFEFEKEMITRIDALVSGGRGDVEYKNLFSELLTPLCEEHQTMKESGLKFVKTICRLVENLLEYRSIIQEENVENRLKCTVNLMEFFSEIKRQEMYIRYLNKLCDLHVGCHNYTEAAFALKLHTQLLKWCDDPLLPLLKNEKYPTCETHRQLKEKLYYEIIDYFHKGHMWEPALEMCKELANQYEHELFDFTRLSALLQKEAEFYDNIMQELRPEPEYFRVAFYGRGFAGFLQNKVFIFRGNEYEKLDEFSGRIQTLFPKAEIMNKLTPPEEDVMEAAKQLLQINKVDAVLEEKKKFTGKKVHDKILRYYKVNEVQKFTFSRPKRKGARDSENEFADLWVERTTMVTSCSLPGILRWFPVVSSDTCEISPLENAIETMRSTNNRIRSTVMAHIADHNLSANPLGMLLNGIVDAAVNGGIAKYEQAFFNETYLQNNEDQGENIEVLKDLIACQIPLLAVGVDIHRVKVHESLRPFHENLEQCFHSMKVSVEEKYGKRQTDLEHKLGSVTLQPKVIASDVHLSAKSLPDINTLGTEAIKPKLQVNLRLSHASSQQKLAGTAARVQSVFSKPIQSSTKTLRKSRDVLPLRRSSGIMSPPESQSQWYDQTPTPVIELSEQLVSQRPRRSEMEKRNSRPSSGNFRNVKFDTNSSPPSTPGGGTSSQSLNSLEDDTPPPVPQKQSVIDANVNPSPKKLSFQRMSSATLRPKNKPLPPLPIKEKTPPVVPKKPSRSPLKDQPVS